MSLELRIPGQTAVRLERKDLTIGSDASADVRLPNARRRHATLKLVAGRWFLEAVEEAPLTINGQSRPKDFV